MIDVDSRALTYELSGRPVCLVVDPHAQKVLGVEDTHGQSLGPATPLDALANVHRPRRKPQSPELPPPGRSGEDNEVELAYRQYHDHTQEDS